MLNIHARKTCGMAFYENICMKGLAHHWPMCYRRHGPMDPCILRRPARLHPHPQPSSDTV
eukprot:363798-Chlamydomonas_euryale.AAC.6